MSNETVSTPAPKNGAHHPSDAAIVAAAIAPDAAIAVEAVAASTEPPQLNWDDLGIHQDVRTALDEMGYLRPTPVQANVFKPVSEGKDLLVQSRTGTGKTTAFGLPIVNKVIPAERTPQALILCPTRELALQVARELTGLAKHRGIVIEALYGGAPIGKQITTLKDGVHIVVGTPGRVIDHINRKTLDTKNIQAFILDECDEMLSMGFLEDIEKVVTHLPATKQTLLFSATMPDEVTRYSRRHMRAPEQISLSSGSVSVSDIQHGYYIVSGIARGRDLLKILFAENPESAIIFCNTRDETTQVAKYLQRQGLDAEPLSSDLSQADRERVMGRMKDHNLRFLCATDVAARGIDISDLSHVINFSFPESPEVYVHRTGRTGRAGKKGIALSIIGPRDLGSFLMLKLTYKLRPEERRVPPDSIFDGKLKHPLPPVGAPQAPDPIAILQRGVVGTPNDLERGLLDKLLAKETGKRVLAMLVAEKLSLLTTKTKPASARTERPERDDSQGERSESRGPRAEGGERSFEPRGDRPDRGPRPERGDRPERSERPFEARGDRPHGDRPSGDRPERGPRPERSDRPFEARGDRPERADRPERNDRPDRSERHERGDRPERTDRPFEARTDRPERTDRPAEARGDRPERTDRPAEARGDRPERTDRPAEARGDRPAEARGDRPERTDRPERNDRFESRGDRGDRGQRPDRGNRHERPDQATRSPLPPIETGAVQNKPVMPAVATTPVAAPKPKTTEGSGAEFWETWAAEKSTKAVESKPTQLPLVAAPTAVVAKIEAKTEGQHGESQRTLAKDDKVDAKSDGKKAKGGKPDKKVEAKADSKIDAKKAKGGKPDKKAETKVDAKADKENKPSKGKAVAAAPAPSAAAGGQVKLFVNLGKKHGLSADDLRALLAKPLGGDRAGFGSVMLRDESAHVKVSEAAATAIIKALSGSKHQGETVKIERA
jgi:ATP-dependent RNA helicase DeaD